MAHVNDHIPCREWQHGRSKRGYGKTWANGKTLMVHRVAWEEAHGPIPEGMYICHHCDNPPCYELAHLFLGTPSDNIWDMRLKGRHPMHDKTHCKNGHPFDEANTRYYWKGRKCRACHAQAQKRQRQKAKALRVGQ